MLDELDPKLEYTLCFFVSCSSAEEQRSTEYSVLGANESSATLQTTGPNTGKAGTHHGIDHMIATVGSIRPDRIGQVFFDMTVVEGSFAYLNDMELTVATP